MPKLPQIARAAVVAAVSLTAFSIPAAARTPVPDPPPTHADGDAAFVQTDGPEGNQIVAYHRADDGTLDQRGVYGTGGLGGVLEGAVVDHLASQGSLTHDRAHRLLYAVNAGSDTVTVFSVDQDRLRKEQIIPSGGVFPVSVAVHGNTVYVLNARDGGSVQGYRISDGRLRPVATWHRDLRLDPTGDPEFTHTPGQVAFTPDGSRLVVTTKAGGNSIEVFPLSASGAPAAEPVVTPREGSVPFGVTFDRAGRLVVADTGPNTVLTYRLDRAGHAVLLDDAPTGQQASCWIVRVGDHSYVSDAGSDTLSAFRQGAGARMRALGTIPTGTGPVDSAVSPDERHLYVRTGGEGSVDVFRVNADGLLALVETHQVPDAVGGGGIVVT